MGHGHAETQIPTFQPEAVSLFCRSGSRDALYFIQLTQCEAGWNVRGQYGRRGSTLSVTEKATNVPYGKAKKIFDKTVKAKLLENPPYRFVDEPKPDATEPKAPASVGLPQSKEVLFSCELLTRLEPSQAMQYVKRERFWFQQKRDDRRLIAVFRDGEAFGLNKLGQRIQLSSEIHAGLCRIAKAGKLISLMFDGEIEASGFWMWDVLDLNGEQIRNQPYSDRLNMLEGIVESLPRDLRDIFHVVPTAKTSDDKLAMWRNLEVARAEGFCIKDSSAMYRPGRAGVHSKVKFEQWASVIVGPKIKKDDHRSVAVYCHNGAKPLRYMGSIGVPDKYPLPEIGQIIEIRYLYLHPGSDGKIYQGKFFGRVRADVIPTECIAEQFRIRQTAEEAAA